MQARKAFYTLREHLTALLSSTSTSEVRNRISLPLPPTFDASDKALVGRWRVYLKWEEGNPLQIQTKDKPQLHLRLQNVYRKAVVFMRFYPEIWLVFILSPAPYG